MFPKPLLFRELLCIIMINKFPKGANMENLDKIQALIKEKAEAEARLNLIPLTISFSSSTTKTFFAIFAP